MNHGEIHGEVLVRVARDGTVDVHVDGDRLEPDRIFAPESVPLIQRDVRAIEALIPGWKPGRKPEFHRLRNGIGRALGGLLFGRPVLFDALSEPPANLPDTAPTVLERELNIALRRNAGRPGALRLVLSFDDPALASLPWEMLVWPGQGEIAVGTDLRFTLVRSLHAPEPGLRAPIGGRPRLLATVSDPASFGLTTPLGPTWDGIVGHVEKHLASAMDVVVASADQLPSTLDPDDGFAVLLALGHGSQRLRLMLPRPGGGGPPFIEVDAATFRDRFAGGGTPRLAILIMCYSAGDAGGDGLGVSAAEAMIDGGCAAVVAMQGTVYLPAAEAFVGEVLDQIGRGAALDFAVQSGRAALSRYGQENAHREAPDHAFRPVLVVRQPADLAPLVPKLRRRTLPVLIGATGLLALLLMLAVTRCEPEVEAIEQHSSFMQLALLSPDLVRIPATESVRIGAWRRPTPAAFEREAVDAFEASVEPVTQAQWALLMGSWPSLATDPSGPVNRVNGYEAGEYLNRLSDLAGLSPCFRMEGCEGEIGSGCGPEQPWCEDGYHCRTIQAVDCTGYRLPTRGEFAAMAGGGSSPVTLGEFRQLTGAEHGDPTQTLESGVRGLLGPGREWAWPSRGTQLALCQCLSRDDVACDWTFCWMDRIRMRTPGWRFRAVRDR